MLEVVLGERIFGWGEGGVGFFCRFGWGFHRLRNRGSLFRLVHLLGLQDLIWVGSRFKLLWYFWDAFLYDLLLFWLLQFSRGRWGDCCWFWHSRYRCRLWLREHAGPSLLRTSFRDQSTLGTLVYCSQSGGDGTAPAALFIALFLGCGLGGCGCCSVPCT